jgi:hypothetical protein
MKFGLAPATSIIFKKESLWIGIESITTTGNEASPGIESMSIIPYQNICTLADGYRSFGSVSEGKTRNAMYRGLGYLVSDVDLLNGTIQFQGSWQELS